MNAANCPRRAPYRVSAALVLALAGAATSALAGGVSPPANGVPALDPECLTITQSSAATYMIENTGCSAQSVLASIELSAGNSGARCFTKKIRTQISIASESAAPIVNYQCIEGTANCSVETLRGMFPECHAG